MDDRTKEILQAVGQVIGPRMKQLQQQGMTRNVSFDVPPPVVNVDVQPAAVVVKVDFSDLAALLEGFADRMQEQNEMLAQLVQVLAAERQQALPEVPRPRRSRTQVVRDANGELDETVTDFEYE